MGVAAEARRTGVLDIQPAPGSGGNGDHGRPAGGARALDQDQGQKDRPLPAGRPDHLERRTERRKGTARTDRAGAHRDQGEGSEKPLRARAHRPFVRSMPRLLRAHHRSQRGKDGGAEGCLKLPKSSPSSVWATSSWATMGWGWPFSSGSAKG